MLKLNYTDYGLHLERVPAPLDSVAAQRAMLAVHVGETLHLEPGRAAFLLPMEIPGIKQLKSTLRKNRSGAIALENVDEDYVEVSLKGTWLASTANAESGTFMTALAPESERLLLRMWQFAQP